MLQFLTIILLGISAASHGNAGSHSQGQVSDISDEDNEDVGEVDEDIIIMDEEDSNDDEGVNE